LALALHQPFVFALKRTTYSFQLGFAEAQEGYLEREDEHEDLLLPAGEDVLDEGPA
jgi:hypothetical protein